MLDAAAFIVWNVGTRPPAQLVADMLHGIRRPASVVRGLLRVAIGAMLLLLAARVVIPATPSSSTFTLAETWTLFAALAVEWLVGDQIRGARPSAGPRHTRSGDRTP